MRLFSADEVDQQPARHLLMALLMAASVKRKPADLASLRELEEKFLAIGGQESK
ncbi:hypothetical protein ABIE89_006445 [Bradyrhizobium niftali]|uniref:hypothetical protein n=1 Tax=Bradyrhizobium niftali TaxID=2560055 RepID=UPI0038390F52